MEININEKIKALNLLIKTDPYVMQYNYDKFCGNGVVGILNDDGRILEFKPTPISGWIHGPNHRYCFGRN